MFDPDNAPCPPAGDSAPAPPDALASAPQPEAPPVPQAAAAVAGTGGQVGGMATRLQVAMIRTAPNMAGGMATRLRVAMIRTAPNMATRLDVDANGSTEALTDGAIDPDSTPQDITILFGEVFAPLDTTPLDTPAFP